MRNQDLKGCPSLIQGPKEKILHSVQSKCLQGCTCSEAVVLDPNSIDSSQHSQPVMQIQPRFLPTEMQKTLSNQAEQERRLRIDATVSSRLHPHLFSMLAGLKENIRGASLLALALEASGRIQISASHLYRMASKDSTENHDDKELSIRLNRYVDKNEYQTLLKHLDTLPSLRGTHIVELAAAGLAGAQNVPITSVQTATNPAPASVPSPVEPSVVTSTNEQGCEGGTLHVVEQKPLDHTRGARLSMFWMKIKRPPAK